MYNADKSKTTITDFKGYCNLSEFSINERIIFKHISYEVYKNTKAHMLRQNYKIFMVLKPNEQDEVVMSISKWEAAEKRYSE